MHIRTNVTLVAFSTDGASALLEKKQDGPEGGGSLSYAVVSAEEPYASAFALSSNFSHGGGDRPQSIDAKTCVENAKALRKLLDDKRFEKIEVSPDACSKDRSAIVASRNNDTLSSVKLDSDKGHLSFKLPAGPVDLGEGDPATTKAYLSKRRKLLVALQRSEYSTSLHGVWRATGETFAVVTLPW
jgi:hypothetical protein